MLTKIIVSIKFTEVSYLISIISMIITKKLVIPYDTSTIKIGDIAYHRGF